MRWRLLFIASVLANVGIGAAWILVSARHPEHETVDSTAESSTVRTNVIVRRQFFSWAEVESSDYSTYIANLRAIGCPEQTVRDIIIADVNALYARKFATEIVTPAQQWWRSTPDPSVARIAAAKTRALNDERKALLTRLLGPGWETGDLASLPRPSHPGLTLDGPVLGALSAETKQAIQGISDRAHDRLQAYLESVRLAGKNPDPTELARLRQETRNELARTLTPQQLEEYLLRYSQDANNLRAELGGLKYFDATPDEFRSIFRATDSIDQQIQLLGAGSDPATAAQRNALLQQRENAIRLALGTDRYSQYVMLVDPAYRDAYAAAQQAGDPQAAQALYQINLATAQQQASIRADTNLTPEQMAVKMRAAELDQAKANALALGQDVPEDQQPATNAPAPEPPPMRTHPYVLGVGETANSIAMTFGISPQSIQAANPGIDLSKLKAGDSIFVPDLLQAR